VGGTSASAPSFAGILALVGQSEFNAGRSRRLGNANLVLYSLATTAANSCDSSATGLNGGTGCVFYNITKGTIAVPCSGAAADNCSATTNGVMVPPASATTPAFPTTPGTGTIPSFDLATGLGSLNVGNLATKWPTATLTATTTATKVNGGTGAVTVGHHTGVVLSADVTGAGGPPTGDVSFIAPTAVNGGIGAIPLIAGHAALPAGTPNTIIPGGTYTIKAHYGGDQTFAPSDDATGVQVTVNKENSGVQSAIVRFDTQTVGDTTFPFGSP